MAALAIPYILHNASVEVFGILTMIWALIGYFSLFDFGLGRALTQIVAREIVRGSGHAPLGVIKSGIFFTMILGILGGLLFACLSYPLAFFWMKVSSGLQLDAFQSLIVASAGIPFVTTTTGYRGVLEGFEDFKTINLFRALLGVANFGLPALSIWILGPELIWMVVGLVAARGIALWVHHHLVKARLGLHWWSKAEVEGGKLKELVHFGAWMTISNIISPVMVVADRFIISAILGASVVAYYTVPMEMLQRVLIVPGALAGVLLPRLSGLWESDPWNARRLYKKSMILLFIGMAVIAGALILSSNLILGLWIGDEFAKNSSLLFSILSVGIFFNGIAQVPFATIHSLGSARPTAILHLLEVFIYILFILLLTRDFGLIGAAWAWTGRVGIDFILLTMVAGRMMKAYR